MWFILTIASMLIWSCADLFYKLSMDNDDPYAYVKIAITLGLVMGISVPFLSPYSESGLTVTQFMMSNKFLMLMPVAYSLSMLYSNIGLRYLEVAIESPLENASGAFPVFFLLAYFILNGQAETLWEEVNFIDITGSVLIVAGIIVLAVIEHRQSVRELKLSGAKPSGRITRTLALIFPLIFCVFDTLETVVCAIVLNEGDVGEVDLLRLYGSVFFVTALVCEVYLFVRTGEVFNPFSRDNKYKIMAALTEDAAYILYVFAIGMKPLFVAPMIASYCAVSIILSRIFLHEHLVRSKFITVIVIITGIVMLGISEGLSYL